MDRSEWISTDPVCCLLLTPNCPSPLLIHSLKTSAQRPDCRYNDPASFSDEAEAETAEVTMNDVRRIMVRLDCGRDSQQFKMFAKTKSLGWFFRQRVFK